MAIHKVEGHANLGKDPITGAVINIDRSQLKSAKLLKNKIIHEKKLLDSAKTYAKRIESLEDTIEFLKNEINNLKQTAKPKTKAVKKTVE